MEPRKFLEINFCGTKRMYRILNSHFGSSRFLLPLTLGSNSVRNGNPAVMQLVIRRILVKGGGVPFIMNMAGESWPRARTPTAKNVKPEKWNKYEILAVGCRIWLAINGQITVALRDPIGELDGQISLQLHGGMPQKVMYKTFALERNPQVKLLGMNESELNKKLTIAPQGFVQPSKK